MSIYDDGAGGEPSPSLPERHPPGHGREHFSRVVVGRLDGHDGAVADGYTDRRGPTSARATTIPVVTSRSDPGVRST